MKKHLLLVSLSGMALCLNLHAEAPSSINSSNNQTTLDKQILSKLAHQTQTHFHFQQEKKMAMLTKPLITEGELTLQDDTVIWDIQKPYAIRYEIHRDLIKEVDTNGERSMSPSGNPLAAALTEAMLAAFSGHWENKENLAALSANGAITQWTLNITPHSTELKKMIQAIVVEGSENNIHQVSIQESNHDSTVIHLTAIP